MLPLLLLCLTLMGCGKGQTPALTGEALSQSGTTEEAAAAGSTYEFELDTGPDEAKAPSDDVLAEASNEAVADGAPAEEASADDTKGDAASALETTADGAPAEEASSNDIKGDVSSVNEAPADALLPDENASYTTRDDVALYIHVYDKLPPNFITKKEAKKLGWTGGSLEEYAPGKCIGGDYYGNYEGLLPEDAEYHECDIDTLGKKKRGAKRIVYSEDGYIYYTGDHYESFELLYEP